MIRTLLARISQGHRTMSYPDGPAPARPRSSLDIALLSAFALSGAAAMVYENAWTRALTLVIGMSTYSFTVMLTTFLVGLGLGSLLYARWWGTRDVGVAGFGLLQLLIAVSALAAGMSTLESARRTPASTAWCMWTP